MTQNQPPSRGPLGLLAALTALAMLAACAPQPQLDVTAPKPRPADAKTTLERGIYR